MPSLFHLLFLSFLVASMVPVHGATPKPTKKPVTKIITVKFNVTVVFQGTAPSLCGKSQVKRLRTTIDNGLDLYGNRFFAQSAVGVPHVAFVLDAKGTPYFIGAPGRRLLDLVDASHRRLDTMWVYEIKGKYVCPPQFCPTKSSPENIDSYLSENLSNHIRFWITNMNANEQKLECLGDGSAVSASFGFL